MSIEMEINDGVAVITMNRPERKNAFTREQYELLADALKNADTNDDVRVVVLTGAGAAFSSGQDLKEMMELASGVASGSPSTSKGGGFTVLLDALEVFSKPLIAAVNGVAVGIGMTLLPFCDLVLIDETARMRVPFSELGVPPEAASSVLFADRIGWQRAAELLLTARMKQLRLVWHYAQHRRAGRSHRPTNSPPPLLANRRIQPRSSNS